METNMYKHLVPARLLELAAFVRRAFEKLAVEEANPSDLCGYCARSSLQLLRLATMEGIRADICLGCSHAFLVLPTEKKDGTVLDLVLDVTATQFGHYDKIQVAPLSTMAAECSAWRVSKRCKTVEEFRNTWGWEGEETYKRHARIVDKEMVESRSEACGA